MQAEGEEGEESAAPKKGGKPVKESAATKRMREEMERRRKIEDEARRCVCTVYVYTLQTL